MKEKSQAITNALTFLKMKYRITEENMEMISTCIDIAHKQGMVDANRKILEDLKNT